MAQGLSRAPGAAQVWVRGADGRTHAFLLKGMEDLRLDARILQWTAVASAAVPGPRTAPFG
jgi:hypothetical protein